MNEDKFYEVYPKDLINELAAELQLASTTSEGGIPMISKRHAQLLVEHIISKANWILLEKLKAENITEQIQELAKED